MCVRVSLSIYSKRLLEIRPLCHSTGACSSKVRAPLNLSLTFISRRMVLISLSLSLSLFLSFQSKAKRTTSGKRTMKSDDNKRGEESLQAVASSTWTERASERAVAGAKSKWTTLTRRQVEHVFYSCLSCSFLFFFFTTTNHPSETYTSTAAAAATSTTPAGDACGVNVRICKAAIKIR